MATRGKPTDFLEKPTGVSWPCSQLIPRDVYPPGPGRCSGNTRGNTTQIQYGMPSAASFPIEPYLNCSSIEAKCCGSVPVSLYHPSTPSRTTKTTTPAVALRTSRHNKDEGLVTGT